MILRTLFFKNRKPKKELAKMLVLPLAVIVGVSLVSVALIFYRPIAYSEKDISDTAEFDLEGMVFAGSAEAPVTVIEFADPLCPGCKSFFENTEPELRRRYVDRGLVKFYHWPMTFFDTSIAPWEAAYCANEQDGYSDYMDYLLSIPRPSGTFAKHARSEYLTFADKIGLDVGIFKQCFESGKYEAWIREKDQQRLDMNITISPTVFVDGNMADSGGPEDVYAEIDRALAKKGN